MGWLFDTDEQDYDATAYAYQDNWSLLRIYNLSAKNSKSLRSDQNAYVEFKAFIKSFKDNFNPGWQETQYPNQSVPIAHQSTPKRTIQIEWTVPSTNAEEAIKNLRKCSFLAQSMYPTLKRKDNKNYGQKSTFMAIKFANLIQSNDSDALPGYISSFSYTPNFAEGTHILNSGQAPSSQRKYFAQKTQKNLFPSLIDISIEFKPIQTRDSFGYVKDVGWNDSPWPYGMNIDPPRTPSNTTSQNPNKTGTGAKVNKGAEGKVTKSQ